MFELYLYNGIKRKKIFSMQSHIDREPAGDGHPDKFISGLPTIPFDAAQAAREAISIAHSLPPTPVFSAGILSRERARLLPEMTKRRDKYFKTVNGAKQIDFDHPDLQAVRQYGNELFDGKRKAEDGSEFGLRINVRELNKENPHMLALIDMPFPELVDYLKKHPHINFIPGTTDFALWRDYPKATADTEQWGLAQFYHDAPLLLEGILASDIPDRLEYAKGMVENLLLQVFIFDGVRNGTNLALSKNSQPPSLTRMVLRVYEELIESGYDREKAQEWLGIGMEAAEIEFNKYWKNPDPRNNHLVPSSELITGGDYDVGTLSEYEDAFDRSAEHHGRPHDYQVVHINAALIEYAWDIGFYKLMRGDYEAAEQWEHTGDTMAAELRTFHDGIVFKDFDARGTKTLNPVWSLGGYRALARGVAHTSQTDTTVEALDQFRGPFGYAHLVPETVSKLPPEDILNAFPPELRASVEALRGPRQWGDGEEINTSWAIDVDEVITGLTKYGYYGKAIDIAEEYILLGVEDLLNHGTQFEKRDVLTGENGPGVEYPPKKHFGWSTALLLKTMKLLPILYELREKTIKKPEVIVVFNSAKEVPQTDEPALIATAPNTI